MNATYSVTLEDYEASIRLHRRLKLSRRLSFAFWYFVLPILAVGGALAFTFLDMSKLTRLAPLLFGVEAALVWLSLFLPIMRFINVRRSFKRVFRPKGQDKSIEIEVTNECIRSVIQGVSEGKFFWNEDMALEQDDKVILIYVAKKRFVPIPASALSVTQQQELRSIFEAKKAGM
jgi:hypothetical protein